MTDGVSAVELARAKMQLRAGLLMTLESPIARAGQMARHILVHGRPLPLEEMVARVDAVTETDLVGFAARLLASAPTLAAIGPVKKLPGVDAISATMAGQKSAVGW
jgi:predicted Zn-dependent peptidase